MSGQFQAKRATNPEYPVVLFNTTVHLSGSF